MSKQYHCELCGKSYKNSRSLNTHKYSYHLNEGLEVRGRPYQSPEKGNAFKGSLHHSKEGSSEQDSSPTKSSEFDECSLQKIWTDILKDKVVDLEIGSLGVERKLKRLETLINLNQTNIKQLEKIMDAIETNADDLTTLDLIDDLSEVRTAFYANEFDRVTSDISKVRQVLKYMLDVMEMSSIDDEGTELLTEISRVSKSQARALIKENFSRITNIFHKLQPEFDEMFTTGSIEGEEESEDSDDSEDSEDEIRSRRGEDDEKSEVESEESDNSSADNESNRIVESESDSENGGEKDVDSIPESEK